MFQWDRNNLRKIRAHRIQREEAEQALLNDPIPVHEQDVEGERRFVYYGETNGGRLLAIVVAERGNRIRVVTLTISMRANGATIWRGGCKENEFDEQGNASHAEVQGRKRGGGLVGQPDGARLCKAEIRRGPIETKTGWRFQAGCDVE